MGYVGLLPPSSGESSGKEYVLETGTTNGLKGITGAQEITSRQNMALGILLQDPHLPHILPT